MNIETADAFHLVRDNVDWAGTNTEKSAAILRAQDYIAAYYTLKPDIDPNEPLLVRATCLLALEFLNGANKLKAERAVIKSKIAVEGVVLEEFEYAEGSPDADLYPFVTATLRPLLSSQSGGFGYIQFVR